MSSIHVLEHHYRTFPHVKSSWSESHIQQLPLLVMENQRQGRCNRTAHVDRMNVKRKSIADRLELSKLSHMNISSLEWLKQIPVDKKLELSEVKLPEKEKEPNPEQQIQTMTPVTLVPKPIPKERTEVKKTEPKPSKVSIKDRLKKNPLFRFHYHVSLNKHINLSYPCRYLPYKDTHSQINHGVLQQESYTDTNNHELI